MIRVWGTYAAPIAEAIGSLTVGVIQSYDSGRPYGANGPVNPFPYVDNPGYATPPRGAGYWFTGRDAFRTEGAASTDLSVTYAFSPGALGSSTELFVQAQVANVFNQGALNNSSRIGRSVLTASNSGAFAPFNPFTEEPVQGTHWDLVPEFGEALDRFAYQAPRMFLFNVGLRF